MFNDEEPNTFKKMHDFSPADGFVEITENMADMIRFVANEPSVGLFYVQQHTHNAAPNLVNLKNKIIEKSHGTSLHTEDLEDSITMVRSMKECGFPIADDMIREIKKSLSVISTQQPKRGLIYNSSSSGYLSSVFKSAKQKADSFKGEKLSIDLSPPFQSVGDSRLPVQKVEIEEFESESQVSKSLANEKFVALYENYEEFKADQESKLEEWLGRSSNER